MEEILDLRHLRLAQLEPLFTVEVEEWRRELLWDYAASLSLIRQYLTARILTGYGLVEADVRGPVRGYGFYLMEEDKAILGDLFVHPKWRDAERSRECRLLGAMLETLQATPGLARIEAQLMSFRSEELRSRFVELGFRFFRRCFYRLDLNAPVALPMAKSPAAGLILEPWDDDCLEDAAELIQKAYAGSADAEINEHYRTRAGALRFLHNVIRFPGCGIFDAQASCRARLAGGQLVGMVLVSRVQSGVAHITQICVRPGLRRAGFGRQLLCAALGSLRLSGYATSTLTVTASNAAASSLYQSLGYREWRDFDAYVWQAEA